MSSVQRIWHYLAAEPFSWLFYCLFQPNYFRQTVEIPGSFQWRRLQPALRVVTPVFLSSLPFMLPAIIIYFPYGQLATIKLNDALYFYVRFMVDLFVLVALSTIVGSFILGIARGITLGWVMNIGFSFLLLFFHINFISYSSLLIIWGGIGGIIAGTVFGAAEDGAGDILGSIVWIANTYLLAVVGNLLSVGVLQWVPPLDVFAFMVVIILLYTLAFFVRLLLQKTFKESGIGKALIWGLIYGLYIDSLNPIIAFFSGPQSVTATLVTNIGVIGLFTVIGFICYAIGYFRLLLYPFSGLSTLWAYLASRHRPEQVFAYLHRSALYWDEYVFLPLPCLSSLLLLAAEQDRVGTRIMQEITFVFNKRPQQLAATKVVSYELALRWLEACHSLEQIAQVHQRLTLLFPPVASMRDAQGVRPFLLLIDVSKDTERYNTSTSHQLRGNALAKLLPNLEKTSRQTAFRESGFNVRLQQVLLHWRSLIEQEIQYFESSTQGRRHILNPYTPGQVLGRDDHLFVGRQDLAQWLAEALGHGHFHTPLLLNGERRMGKSSLLRHLPRLLAANYIPIFCDLQMGGVTSSVVALLATVAYQISEALLARELKVSRLEYRSLQEAVRSNEAAVYHLFNQWYRAIEQRLEQEGHIVLLAFDEFEQLESARQTGYLDLAALLAWLHNLLQNTQRLAILFCGVSNPRELGVTWSSYFGAVQPLKVSFLSPAEARQLIVYANTQQEIFATEEVIEEIMHASACQPFLVQALCSTLIDTLNTEARTQAELSDFPQVREQVLHAWDSYFLDLWQRTDEPQRRCLHSLQTVGPCSHAQLTLQSNLDESTLQDALSALLRRDLIVQLSEGTYHFSIPLFQQWLTWRS